MHHMPVGVAEPVVKNHIPEGHITDHGVEVSARESRVSEALCADLGVRVKSSSDRRRRGVQLDAHHPRRIGREADERAGTRPRLEHRSPKSQVRERRPHRARITDVGVVSVDRGSSGIRECLVIQQFPQLRSLRRPAVIAVIEHLRDGAPA